MDIWKILGIEPTKDKKEIKQAFAEKVKLVHPEEDPKGFEKLYNSYKLACKMADYSLVETKDEPSETKSSEMQVVVIDDEMEDSEYEKEFKNLFSDERISIYDLKLQILKLSILHPKKRRIIGDEIINAYDFSSKLNDEHFCGELYSMMEGGCFTWKQLEKIHKIVKNSHVDNKNPDYLLIREFRNRWRFGDDLIKIMSFLIFIVSSCFHFFTVIVATFSSAAFDSGEIIASLLFVLFEILVYAYFRRMFVRREWGNPKSLSNKMFVKAAYFSPLSMIPGLVLSVGFWHQVVIAVIAFVIIMLFVVVNDYMKNLYIIKRPIHFRSVKGEHRGEILRLLYHLSTHRLFKNIRETFSQSNIKKVMTSKSRVVAYQMIVNNYSIFYDGFVGYESWIDTSDIEKKNEMDEVIDIYMKYHSSRTMGISFMKGIKTYYNKVFNVVLLVLLYMSSKFDLIKFFMNPRWTKEVYSRHVLAVLLMIGVVLALKTIIIMRDSKDYRKYFMIDYAHWFNMAIVLAITIFEKNIAIGIAGFWLAHRLYMYILNAYTLIKLRLTQTENDIFDGVYFYTRNFINSDDAKLLIERIIECKDDNELRKNLIFNLLADDSLFVYVCKEEEFMKIFNSFISLELITNEDALFVASILNMNRKYANARKALNHLVKEYFITAIYQFPYVYVVTIGLIVLFYIIGSFINIGSPVNASLVVFATINVLFLLFIAFITNYGQRASRKYSKYVYRR